MNDPNAPLTSSVEISPIYIGCTHITNPTPNPCKNRAIHIKRTDPVVSNKIKGTIKNKELHSRVHFLPITFAKGPAINGPETQQWNQSNGILIILKRFQFDIDSSNISFV